MAIHKVLSGTSSILARNNVLIKKNNLEAIRTLRFVIGTPPTVKIPFAEKVVLGTVLSVAIMAYPTWVMYHMPEYNGKSR